MFHRIMRQLPRCALAHIIYIALRILQIKEGRSRRIGCTAIRVLLVVTAGVEPAYPRLSDEFLTGRTRYHNIWWARRESNPHLTD